MPMRSDSMREAGEVEDGEIDSPTFSSSNSNNGRSRSPPKLSVSLTNGGSSSSRSIAGRAAKRVFEDDGSGSSSSTSASGFKIKGSAAGPSSQPLPMGLPQKPVAQPPLAASPSTDPGAISIKGRSSGSAAVGSSSNGIESERHSDTRREAESRPNSAANDDAWPLSRRNGMSIAGAAAARSSDTQNTPAGAEGSRKAIGLPSKPKTLMPMPFKPKAGAGALPTGPAAMRNQEPLRAETMSRGYSTETGYAYPAHNDARESSSNGLPRLDKGKHRETEDGEMEEEGETYSSRPSKRSQARSPERSYGGYYDSAAVRHEDDRRHAGHGRASAFESGYRSPGYHSSSQSRDDWHHGSSRRDYRYDEDRDRRYSSHRKPADDYYRSSSRRQGEASSESRHRDRDRYRSRSRSRERDSRRHRHHSPDDDDARWDRGSSYSPNRDGRRDRGINDRDGKAFHDEPGAPRHPSRELAPKQSATNTPAAGHALPPKPNFIAEPRKQPEQPKVKPPPRPQVATPFFLPSPPAKDTTAAAESAMPDDNDLEMDIDEASKVLSPSAGVPPVQARQFTLFGTSRLDDYQLEEKLGEGTFGVVHKARRKADSVRVMPPEETAKKASRRSRRENKAVPCASRVKGGDVVALKKIVMHNDMDGIPITALREIRILKCLNHPNVVDVVDMAFQPGDFGDLRRGTIYMVFPYMAHDLAGLLENKSIDKLDPSVLKLYAKQLLEGTSYLHRNRILHRDMKAANLLISDEGVLQIADFGLARSIEDCYGDARREYTNCVVTRWYRPPELLLGLKAYGRPIDMWGVGCVIGEMFLRHPVFTGASDLDQLAKIVQMCGPINDESMPGWSEMPDSKIVNFPHTKRTVIKEFMRFSDDVADLLDKLLVLDPEVRLTADEALDHDWFWTDPMPAEPGSVKIFPSSHEYDKRKAHEERQGNGGERNRAAQEAAFRGPNQVVKIPSAVQPQPQQVVQPPPPPAVLPGPARWLAQPQLPPQQQPQAMRPAASWGPNGSINIHLGGPSLQPNGLPQRPTHPPAYAAPISNQPTSVAPGLPQRPSGYPPAHSSLPRPPHIQHGLPPRPVPPAYGHSNDSVAEPDLKRRRMANEPRQIAGVAARMAAGARNGSYAEMEDGPAGGAEPSY